MTRLEIFNRVFQFTGFRVARILKGGRQVGWGLLGPVLPLTGWSNRYVGWPAVRVQWMDGVGR